MYVCMYVEQIQWRVDIPSMDHPSYLQYSNPLSLPSSTDDTTTSHHFMSCLCILSSPFSRPAAQFSRCGCAGNGPGDKGGRERVMG